MVQSGVGLARCDLGFTSGMWLTYVLLRFLCYVWYCQWNKPTCTSISEHSLSSLKVMATLRTHGVRQQGPIDIPILYTLLGTRESESTIPHDRIYALMGLITDSSSDGVVVDYDLPHEVIHEHLARYCISQARLGFLVLSSAGYHGTHSHVKLPSWVPDWTFKPRTISPNMLHEMVGFHAATELERKIIAHSESQVLSIAGFVYDTLETIATRPTRIDRSLHYQPSVENVLELADEQIETLREVIKIATLANPYPTGRDWEEACGRCIICNQLGFEPAVDEPSVEENFKIGYREIKYLIANFEHVIAQRVDLYDGERMDRYNRAVLHFDGLIDKLCHGRKFCASSKRYLGWVPEEAITDRKQV